MKLKSIIAALLGLFVQATHATPIAYTDHGKGKAIILIHAFPTDQHLWAPQKELQKHFRVVTLDLWGFGKSPAVNHDAAVSMTDYADEVKQLMNKLHIDKAIIGGESMGGYIALAFLQKYPDNVAGLILSDTQAVADTAEAQKKRETIAETLLKDGTAEFITGFINNAVSVSASEKVKADLLAMMQSQKAEGMAAALRGMSLRADTSSILSGTQLPVLILSGDQDKVISPQQSDAMHQLAKNSKLVVIHDAGHLSNLEQPVQWNKAVEDFFETN